MRGTYTDFGTNFMLLFLQSFYIIGSSGTRREFLSILHFRVEGIRFLKDMALWVVRNAVFFLG